MRNIKRYILYPVVCMVFMMCMMMSAGAATDDEEITKVTLTVTADVGTDSGSNTLNVTADNSRFQIKSFDFIGGNWKPGEKPKVKVVLTAAEGYTFSSRMTAGRVTVKNTGTCKSVKRIDQGDSLEVTIELKAVPGTLGTIDDAYWMDAPLGKAKWDEAKRASAYQVKLYYKDSVIKTVDKTTVNYFDFYSYMTKPGTYYFKVRAIPRNSSESTYTDTGEWVNSNELYIENEKTAPVYGQNPSNNQGSPGTTSPGASSPGQGGVVSSNAGWLSDGKGWRYRDNGGAIVSNNWSLIDNKWYFFDMAGYMETGWQQKSGRYYYFTVNGDMVTGWLEDNKKWYYLGGDGAMVTGWVPHGGEWYYTNMDGAMAYGWTNVDKKWYYFNLSNGIMMKNTIVDNKYINEAGVYIE